MDLPFREPRHEPEIALSGPDFAGAGCEKGAAWPSVGYEATRTREALKRGFRRPSPARAGDGQRKSRRISA
eukprot:scaffold12_cov337-Prasinococcus_capsulatus_cf.AAC.3